MDLSVLERSANEGYGDSPLPSYRDGEVSKIVAVLFEEGSGVELRLDHVDVLLAFAERMASLARRTGSHRELITGIRAAALALTVGDQRDGVLVLSLLWRTTEVLGIDAASTFRSTALDVGSSQLDEFADRLPENRSIESMGYVEIEDEDGFRYERTW